MTLCRGTPPPPSSLKCRKIAIGRLLKGVGRIVIVGLKKRGGHRGDGVGVGGGGGVHPPRPMGKSNIFPKRGVDPLPTALSLYI